MTYTTPVDARAIDSAALATTAHLIQEWVPKQYDARVTMVDRQAFTVAIQASSDQGHVDWRSDYGSLTYGCGYKMRLAWRSRLESLISWFPGAAMTDWEAKAIALADKLEANGHLTDPRWRAAVGAVPRHVFVPQFYDDDRNLVDGAEPEQQHRWLSAVYSDVSLVTKITRIPDTDVDWFTS